MTSPTQTLYFGDNLPIMQKYLADESVDLIYLDPPFNSQRDYNILFKDESGRASDAQILAFEDTWHWGREAQETYEALILKGNVQLGKTLEALFAIVGQNQTLAYLVMMAARLVELHRILKPTGTLYLHCDSTAGHYLKLVLDAIFGKENFRNQIIWKRAKAKGNTKRNLPKNHDIIFRYTKSEDFTWNALYNEHDKGYIKEFYRYVEPETERVYRLDNLVNPSKKRPNLTYEFLGVTRVWRWTKERMQAAYDEGLIVQSAPGAVPRLKRYLDEQEGTPIDDVWVDIAPVQGKSKERVGYPTQKPLALLERIIGLSSQEGDIVLDPFAGCGTTIAAAHKLGRQWVGIDITHLGIGLLKYRLRDMFGLKSGQDYRVLGEPTTVSEARVIARDSENDGRYQFQFWALSLVEALPLRGQEKGSPKKGADQGIDGIIRFFDSEKRAESKQVLVQVKSGKVKSGDVRDLRGALEREQAAIALLLTLEAPTSEMEREALNAGVYTSPLWGKSYRRVQILTIEALLAGATPDLPPRHGTFPRLERAKERAPEQDPLL